MEQFKQKTTIFTKTVILFIILIISMISISTYVSIHYESKVTKESIIFTGEYIAEFIASSTENAFYSLNWIFVSKMLHDTVKFMDSQLIYALLVRENGKVYMASDEIYKKENFKTDKFTNVTTIIDNYKFPDEDKHGILMIKFLKIGNKKFYVILGLSIDPIHRKNRTIIIRNTYIGAIFIIVGLLFSLMVSRNISRPITKLANAVKEISPSNMVLTVETGSRDEVGVLENRFKTMLNNLRVTQSDLEFSTQELEETATQLKTANDRLEFRVKERTRELEDAQAEQERLITILESTSDIVMSVMPDATITYINNAGRKMMGWSQNDDIRLKKISDLHPQWALNKIKNKGIPSAIAKNIWGGETAIIGADGKERPVSQVIMAHTLSNGKLDYLSTIMRDITERKQAQKELMDTKNYIDDIINSMPSVLVGVDEECRVTQCNMQAEKKTNIKTKNAMGKKLIDIFPHMATQTDRIRKAIKTCEIQFDPKQSLQRDGETIYEDVTIYPLVAGSVKGAVIRIDDVTDKVGMEEMIIQSEKMLSVGGLAAGMAHEINNPLAGIMQNTDLILRRIRNDMPANDRVAEEAGTTMEAIRSFMTKRKMVQHLEMIHYAGAQAAKIVQNMLSFSRQDKSGKSEQNLAELFNQTVDLAASDYDLKNKYDFKQIEIIREYESSIPNVPCEPSKIQQVFFNILKNGAQAMHENKKRTKKPQFILRVSKEENMVRAEIQDNGPGMKEKNSKHIFEPFYTTKGVGAGTGLGLSISYFIIKEDHGGTIEVESVPEKGTKFIIRLPLKKET